MADGEFSREWREDEEPSYLLESAELDLLRLYALPLPSYQSPVAEDQADEDPGRAPHLAD